MACKRPRTQDIVALKLEELKRKHEQLRKRTKTEQLQCASAKNSVTTDSVPPSKPSFPQTDSATLTDNLLCNTNQKERSTTTNLRAPHRLNGSSLSSSLPSDCKPLPLIVHQHLLSSGHTRILMLAEITQKAVTVSGD